MSSTNPVGIDRLAQLNALHLYGMATAWSELAAEGPRRPVQPEAWLDRLIEAELADRQVRSLRYQLKAPRFPVHRDLTGIDWAETPLPQAQIQQLASAGFMEMAHNLILVGGTGTGKTHLATALGVAAIHQGKRVRFFNAVDLVNQLEREKQQGKAGNMARQLVQTDAVIIDELGYLPFPASGGALLFHLISIRSTKGEDESPHRPISLCDSASPCAVRSGSPGRAAQAASRRGLRGRQGQGRVASADRRAEHGACGCFAIDT